MGNFVATFVRYLACCLFLAASVEAGAQNTTIGSQAGQQVGSSETPSCHVTVYGTENCPHCKPKYNGFLNQKNSDPQKYGCNTVDYVSCGLDFNHPGPPCSDLGYTRFPTVIGQLCDCRVVPPDVSPGPGLPPGNPQPPPSNGVECTGQAKIKCPAKGGWGCCLFACDSTQPSGCLNCGGYRPCGKNSCPADKTCVNKKDDKGCPRDFVCEGKVTPPDHGGNEVCDPVTGVCGPAGHGSNEVCDPLTGVCGPPNPFNPPVVVPDPPVQQPDPPKPPTGPQCVNPCPSQSNPNNCCGPTQGCYQGTCSNYSGCTGCKKGQICSPIDRAPWYGCKDAGSPKAPSA